MNIIIINTLYYPYRVGGAEISVQLLAEELFNLGHSVKVLCLHPENDKKEDIINGVRVTYLPLKNLYWPFNAQKQSKFRKMIWHLKDYYNIPMGNVVDEEIKCFKPDVVHTNNLSGFSLSVWKKIKKRNIKLVHTTRDFYLFYPNASLFRNSENIAPSKIEVKVFSFFRKKMSNKVDCFVGISRFMRDFHINNGFFQRAKVKTYIYNTIEISNVFPTNKKEVKKIGYIGRMNIEKGFDVFCDLAKKNLELSSDYHFVAAGLFDNSPDSAYLNNMAKSSGVELLGYINIEDFFKKVDVIVFPIRWKEPFGRVIVECILAGKVVITNPIGGVTELKEIIPNLYFMDDVIDENGVINFDKITIIEITENHKQLFNKNEITRKYLELFN